MWFTQMFSPPKLEKGCWIRQDIRHELVINSNINQPATAESMVLIVARQAAAGEFLHTVFCFQGCSKKSVQNTPCVEIKKFGMLWGLLYTFFPHFLQTLVLQ